MVTSGLPGCWAKTYGSRAPECVFKVSTFFLLPQKITLNSSMDNQDFSLFSWGTHDNHHKNYYGLTNSAGNKLYLVGEDVSKLRLLQFIVLSSNNLLLLKLSDISNYGPGMLDNQVCLDWGISSPHGLLMNDGRAGNYFTKKHDQLVPSAVPTTVQDLELQKNLFYILGILDVADNFINDHINQVPDVSYYNDLLDFFKIIMPGDTDLIRVVQLDQTPQLSLTENIKNLKNIIVELLSDLDYNKNYETVRNDLHTTIFNIVSGEDSVEFEKTHRTHYKYKNLFNKILLKE